MDTELSMGAAAVQADKYTVLYARPSGVVGAALKTASISVLTKIRRCQDKSRCGAHRSGLNQGSGGGAGWLERALYMCVRRHRA